MERNDHNAAVSARLSAHGSEGFQGLRWEEQLDGGTEGRLRGFQVVRFHEHEPGFEVDHVADVVRQERFQSRYATESRNSG